MTPRPAVRAGLAYLAVTFLATGAWATLRPASFYHDFPGAGQHWVAGDGAYNRHLVSDAGVGFLAVGTMLLLGALWRDRRVAQAALVAAVVHGLPHLGYHLANPGVLSSTGQLLRNGALAFGTALAAALLVALARPPAPREVSHHGRLPFNRSHSTDPQETTA